MTTYTGFQAPRPEANADTIPALRQHTRQLAQSIGGILQGKINAVYPAFTCLSGTTTTVLVDSRLTPTATIQFDPVTANAATELANGTIYAKTADRNKGTWNITHASAASGDRTFRLLIIG